jgi:predicted Zn-dependent protease
LKEDPNNTSAHETMGYLAFRAGNLDEAKKWYGQAVQLGSRNYLAHYYFAVMSMQRPEGAADDDDGEHDDPIENSLRTSIKLNPQFAPSFDALAVFLARHHRDLDEADMMGLTAVSLDPENIAYRVNVAKVLMTMQRPQAAIQVLQVAAKIAKTPQEIMQVKSTLTSAQSFASARQRQAEMQKQRAEDQAAEQDDVDATPASSQRAKFVPKGPHHFLTGVLKDVRCNNPELDLTVASKVKNLALHADNYYQIQFTTLNFVPQGDLNPCKDLEGRPARVEYVESTDHSVIPLVLSVELHK